MGFDKEKAAYGSSTVVEHDLYNDKNTNDDYNVSVEVAGVTEELQPERWGSRASFVIASIGSAIGLGNFWRFPYLVYKWGGGSFFIPYVLSLFVVGIPVLILELTIGQIYQTAAIKGFHSVSKGFKVSLGGIGITSSVVSFLIVCYYCVVMAWSIIYLVESFYPELPWSIRDANETNANRPEVHFNQETLHMSEGIQYTTFIVSKIFAAALFQWICVYLCLWKGVKATGKVVYVSVLVPCLMLIVLLVRGCTLDGASTGINEYIGTWDMSKLNNGDMWIEACTQIIFSVSVAFGVMTAYGSFNEPNSNVVQNAFIIASCNCLFSFVTGFCVFSIVGHLAYIKGMEFEELRDQLSGVGLAFVTYPAALSLMPGVSANIFCVLFFLTFFMLGIDSAFSIVEGIVSNLKELSILKNIKKGTLLIVVCSLGFLGSTMYCADNGLYMLDVVDYYTNNILLLWIVLMETVAVTLAHDHKGLCDKVGKKAAYLYNAAIFCGYPFLLMITFILWEYTSAAITYGVVFGALLSLLIAVVLVATHFGSYHQQSYFKSFYALMFHRADHLAERFNEVITEGGTNGNWRVNIVWVFMITDVIPFVTALLLSILIRNLARTGGYSRANYPLAFQLLGGLICLVALAVFIAPMVYPSIIEENDDDDNNNNNNNNNNNENKMFEEKNTIGGLQGDEVNENFEHVHNISD